MAMDYQKHGLRGKLKRTVFDALLERQRGKCFICWVSQAEIEERGRERLKERITTYEEAGIPLRHLSLSPVYYTLHIDHCHTSGAIRGLLCEHCNLALSVIENYGVDVEDDYWPPDWHEENRELYECMIERSRAWLNQHRTIILLYMQRERWFPRKDILFHLQARA